MFDVIYVLKQTKYMFDVSNVERVLNTAIFKIAKISEAHAVLCAKQPYFENLDYHGGVSLETFQDKMNEFRMVKRGTYSRILSNAAKKVKVRARMLDKQDAYFRALPGYDPKRNLWLGFDEGALKAFRKASRDKLAEITSQRAVDISLAMRIKPFFDPKAKVPTVHVVRSVGYISNDLDLKTQNLLDEIYKQRLSSTRLSLYGISLTCRLAMISHDAAVYIGCALRQDLFDEDSVPDVHQYIRGELETAKASLDNANKAIQNLREFIEQGLVGMKKDRSNSGDLDFVYAGLDLVL